MDEFRQAVDELLFAIEDMQEGTRYWYGGFSDYRERGEGWDVLVSIEWPNLAIMAERVREAARRMDYKGE